MAKQFRFVLKHSANWIENSLICWNLLAKEVFSLRNFNTECFFLAFMSHHLAIMPIINKYQRRIRVIREINKVIEEIKQHLWKSTPLAQCNRYLSEKWKKLRELQNLANFLSIIKFQRLGCKKRVLWQVLNTLPYQYNIQDLVGVS